MSVFSQLLGAQLEAKNGAKVNTDEALKNKKIVGLYFSAHWCPPCRGFTPKLADAYTKNLKNQDFEILFISSDRDATAMKEYFNDMPWLALPFDQRDIKQKLGEKFSVNGIPKLVFLDAKTGAVLSENGRNVIMTDASAKEVMSKVSNSNSTTADAEKAKRESVGSVSTRSNSKTSSATSTQVHKSILSLLPAELKNVGSTSSIKTETALANKKLIAFYFSAHWCPPCRGFTPKLAEAYSKNLKNEGMEIVFVSSDQNESAMGSYHKEMPWLAVPFGDKQIEHLGKKYKVSGIPDLLILDAMTGEVVERDGRSAVTEDAKLTKVFAKVGGKRKSSGIVGWMKSKIGMKA